RSSARRPRRWPSRRGSHRPGGPRSRRPPPRGRRRPPARARSRPPLPRDGEEDGHLGAAARIAGQADPPSLRLEQVPREAEAHARSRGARAARRLAPERELEGALLLTRAHAHSRVADDDEGLGARPAGPYPDLAAGWRVLHRVVEDVAERALDRERI